MWTSNVDRGPQIPDTDATCVLGTVKWVVSLSTGMQNSSRYMPLDNRLGDCNLIGSQESKVHRNLALKLVNEVKMAYFVWKRAKGLHHWDDGSSSWWLV